MSIVYVMLFNRQLGRNEVVFARDYQREAFNDYVNNNRSGKVDYTAKNDATIKFSIDNFDYKNMGLQSNYDDFYHFIREDNIKYIMSTNEEKLRGFCGYINRITT
jgi:hypothetical protein